MPRVRYAPLRSTASIRVLIVQPGDEHSPISGSFAEIDLASGSKLAYECLSYTWGEAGNEMPIWIDGRELLIRQNLYAFIVRLRKEQAPRTLWADFICIDQENLKEKTQQVQMMGVIYSQAITVRAWVGAHADRSEELFHAWPERTGLVENLRRTFGMLLSHKEQAYRKAVWAPFLARTYWTRTWIVQELALAREVYIHCGDDCMSWEDLISSRVVAPMNPGKFSLVRWDIDGIAFCHEYNEQLHLVRMLCKLRVTTGGGGLLGLVSNYGSSTQCSNPLDKVYAFLAMAQDSPDLPAMVPDYGASAAEVLLQVWLRSILQQTKAVRPTSPGPFMNMMAFSYADDCQFADFLLDVFETQYALFLKDSTSRKAFSPFYNAFIDAVQAIYDSGRQSQAQRLGKILPPKIEWFRTHAKNPHGQRSMTFPQREQENFNRFAFDKEFLWNCREELRQAGNWACTKDLRDLVNPSNFILPLTRPAPTADDPAFGGFWHMGTQPIQELDEDNRPFYHESRRWHQSKRLGYFIRPSAVDTWQVRQELSNATAQQVALQDDDYVAMPFMFGLDKLSR